METFIPGASYRPPSTVLPEYIEDVIEVVLALKAHDEGRVAMMLEDGGSNKGGFEAVGLSPFQGFYGRSNRLTPFFPVVREGAKEFLDREGGFQALGQKSDLIWSFSHHFDSIKEVKI